MKILILVNNLSYFVSHRMSLAQVLVANKYEVVVAYGEPGNIDPKYVEKKGFKVCFVSMTRGGTNFFEEVKTIHSIWQLFKKERPKIVHLITIKPYLYGGIIARLTNVPVVVSAIAGLGTLFIQQDLKTRFLRSMLYPLYRLAFGHSNQRLIVQNKSDKKTLISWGVTNSKKFFLIKGSGVNLDNFNQLEEAVSLPTICFAGRLIKEKGIYEFVSAARYLIKKGIKARFWIAGDMDLKNPSGLTKKQIKQISGNKNIRLLGYQKNIPNLFSKSHIICLPSYREGLPKVLIEAAAACRAVVTTNIPGCRDAVVPNKTGLLVPVKNPQKLAEAIEWLIENPQKRIAMGKAGRKLAEQEFTIEKTIQSHLKLYEELVFKIQ